MLNELLRRPLIPVIVIDDVESAEPLAEALLAGGMDVVEITFRTSAAASVIKRIRKVFPDMLIGAGTVVSPEQAQRALDAGVDFGLAPGLNPETVKTFQRSNILFIPGVMTPSEIQQGLSLGCKLLKFFPAGPAGGPAMLSSMGAPYASMGLKFCPTGGVNLENMNTYLSLPLVSNIGGTWLASKQQIEEKQWKLISDQVRTALARINEGS